MCFENEFILEHRAETLFLLGVLLLNFCGKKDTVIKLDFQKQVKCHN